CRRARADNRARPCIRRRQDRDQSLRSAHGLPRGGLVSPHPEPDVSRHGARDVWRRGAAGDRDFASRADRTPPRSGPSLRPSRGGHPAIHVRDILRCVLPASPAVGLMFPNAAHRHSWETFEAIFCIPFLVAIALEFLHGLSFPEGVRQVAVPVGAALIVAGLVVGVLARRELARRGQPTNPGLPTTGLVTTGVFSISRNPLYLGGAGIVGGIGLAFNL